MADKRKKHMEVLENLSSEELQQRIKEEKKRARRSIRFALTALIAIIAVCIAWFVANNRVSMTGAQVSAENDEPFEIASVGYRLNDEKNYLKNESGNILSEGIQKRYKTYIDAETGEKTTLDKERVYYTGGSGIAWHMNNKQSLVPGAGGKLEFYLIPKQEGLTKATISFNLEGYKLNDDKNKVEKIKNKKIQSLINGHILFFKHVDDEYGYSGWLGEKQELVVTAPKSENEQNATFQKDIPYKVTLYWKWPQYFRNYIYTQRSAYGDLFTDKTSQKDGSDYKELTKFVNQQRDVIADTGKLFYDAENKKSSIEGEISNTMSDEVLNACNSYYNQADEYIGKNTQYVYIQVDVN